MEATAPTMLVDSWPKMASKCGISRVGPNIPDLVAGGTKTTLQELICRSGHAKSLKISTLCRVLQD